MFIETKPFLTLENDLEKKYYFFLDENILENKYIYNKNTSLNALILINNNCLFCERQDSFYWTFLLNNFKKYNLYLYKKYLLDIVKNLILEEFLAFYLFLKKNNIISNELIIDKNKINFENIQKKYNILNKGNINIDYLKEFYSIELCKIFDDFENKKIIIKNHHNLILPGGKFYNNDKNIFSTIFREIKEEINLDMLNVKLNILNNNFIFEEYKEKFKPKFLYIKIFDKVLKKYFNNLCIIIKFNLLYDINFIKNKEIKNIFYIKTEKDNFEKKKFISLLYKYNFFFKNE